MTETDVVLQILRIESGKTAEVESLHEKLRSQSTEVRLSLEEMDVYAGAAFVHSTDDGDYLYNYVECKDWEQVQRAYEDSESGIAQLHRDVLGDVVDEDNWKNDELTPEFQIVV